MSVISPEIERILNESSLTLAERFPEDNGARAITEHIVPLIEKLASNLAKNQVKDRTGELKRLRRDHLQFMKRNKKRWSLGLNALEALLATCREIGSEYNQKFRSESGTANVVAKDLLFRLHARACQTTHEIVCLLENGFAEGAQARWRALHEITVTGLFIAKHGDDVALRFFDHEVVEAHKGATLHQQFIDRTGQTPFSPEELEGLSDAYQAALIKYGKNFAGAYGWASEALGIPAPNFQQLEKDIELDHLRPFYKWASQTVHSNVGGLKNTLGLCEASDQNVLLAGPSNSGLTDPAHTTALSLAQITAELLKDVGTWESALLMLLLSELEEHVLHGFLSADTQT